MLLLCGGTTLLCTAGSQRDESGQPVACRAAYQCVPHATCERTCAWVGTSTPSLPVSTSASVGRRRLAECKEHASPMKTVHWPSASGACTHWADNCRSCGMTHAPSPWEPQLADTQGDTVEQLTGCHKHQAKTSTANSQQSLLWSRRVSLETACQVQAAPACA